MRVAGIDQGTTSTRAIVVNSDGKLEVVRSIAHRQSFPHDGWVEQDPEEILRNLKACIDSGLWLCCTDQHGGVISWIQPDS